MRDPMDRKIELVKLLSDLMVIRQEDREAILDVVGELDTLRARVAQLEAEKKAAWADAEAFRDMAYQVPKLRSDLEKEQADAARWRYVRSRCFFDLNSDGSDVRIGWPKIPLKKQRWRLPFGAAFDAAIDKLIDAFMRGPQ